MANLNDYSVLEHLSRIADALEVLAGTRPGADYQADPDTHTGAKDD